MPEDYDGDYMIEVVEPSVDSLYDSYEIAFDWARHVQARSTLIANLRPPAASLRSLLHSGTACSEPPAGCHLLLASHAKAQSYEWRHRCQRVHRDHAN